MVGENQRQVPWNNKNTESIGGWQNYDGLLMDEGCLRIYVSFTAIAETKPSERTCGYWILNNHNGTKNSGGVLVLLQNICFEIYMLETYVQCEDGKRTANGKGKGSGRGRKRSLVPSCRQRRSALQYSLYLQADMMTLRLPVTQKILLLSYHSLES